MQKLKLTSKEKTYVLVDFFLEATINFSLFSLAVISYNSIWLLGLILSSLCLLLNLAWLFTLPLRYEEKCQKYIKSKLREIETKNEF